MKSINEWARDAVQELVLRAMASAAGELSNRAVHLSQVAVDLRREVQRAPQRDQSKR